MKSKIVETIVPAAVVVGSPVVAPDILPGVAPGAVPPGVVPPGAFVVPLATEVIPIIHVPSDTPAADLPDALAPLTAPVGSVQTIDGSSQLPARTLSRTDGSYDTALQEKIRAGLTRDQAVIVLDSQLLHDAGLTA